MQDPLPLCALLLLTVPAIAQKSSVPFVGCPSDGQVGALAAPRDQTRRLRIPREVAARVAWYQSRYAPGVLAPRGWHCFSTYGSNGATLYVSPGPLNSKLVFSNEWKGFSGRAIEISSMNGGTSGRFEVAQKIARLFPEHMDFARQVIAEGLEPASDFPIGPYPDDRLSYKAKTLVDFETPAHKEGFGTESRLQPNDEPIKGFVYLSMEPNDDPYEISLEMRLPLKLTTLGPVIRSELEPKLKTLH